MRRLGEHQDVVVDEVGLVLQQLVLLGDGRGEEVGAKWESETRSAWDRIGGEDMSAWAGLGWFLPVPCVCVPVLP